MANQKKGNSLVWGIILIVFGVIFLLEQFHIDVWDAGLALLARHPDRLGRQQALARAQGAQRALRDARPGQDP
ncbi:MAG: hypothetical protein M0C28_21005 [Candidatus Moduliflexus flocculans]|nr:hypothetical protein [Candidatus Moduliflexus flocculans]